MNGPTRPDGRSGTPDGTSTAAAAGTPAEAPDSTVQVGDVLARDVLADAVPVEGVPVGWSGGWSGGGGPGEGPPGGGGAGPRLFDDLVD
ncbi:hypothetical protein ACFXGE_42865, partial [Streptomyces sp. NPDC059378]